MDVVANALHLGSSFTLTLDTMLNAYVREGK